MISWQTYALNVTTKSIQNRVIILTGGGGRLAIADSCFFGVSVYLYKVDRCAYSRWLSRLKYRHLLGKKMMKILTEQLTPTARI